eukprot:6944729-Prorocentrum_lima.AAC.1
MQPHYLQIVRIVIRKTQIHGINQTGSNKKNRVKKKKHTKTHNNNMVTTMNGSTMGDGIATWTLEKEPKEQIYPL